MAYLLWGLSPYLPEADWCSPPASGSEEFWFWNRRAQVFAGSYPADGVVNRELPRRIEESEVIGCIRLANENRFEPFAGHFGNLWGVREDVRALIERFEPGKHQFIPLSLLDTTGRAAPFRYAYLNILEWFDAIIVSKSAVEWRHSLYTYAGEPHLEFIDFCVKDNSKLVMSKPQIAGRHLWRGHRMMRGRYFCSDEFYAALKAQGLAEFLVVKPVAEAEEPWTDGPDVHAYERWKVAFRRALDERREKAGQ